MSKHIAETLATQFLKTHQVPFTEHPYDRLDHGCAQVLGLDPLTVVNTLIMEDDKARPVQCALAE